MESQKSYSVFTFRFLPLPCLGLLIWRHARFSLLCSWFCLVCWPIFISFLSASPTSYHSSWSRSGAAWSCSQSLRAFRTLEKAGLGVPGPLYGIWRLARTCLIIWLITSRFSAQSYRRTCSSVMREVSSFSPSLTWRSICGSGWVPSTHVFSFSSLWWTSTLSSLHSSFFSSTPLAN